MGSILYAVAVRRPNLSGRRGKWIRSFRAPSASDREALVEAESALGEVLRRWLSEGVLPHEEIGTSNYDRGHRLYGMSRWIDMFSPRQLLVHGVYAEEFRRILPEILAAEGDEEGRAVAALLGLVQGKALNWDSISCTWMTGRQQ